MAALVTAVIFTALHLNGVFTWSWGFTLLPAAVFLGQLLQVTLDSTD